MNEGNRFPRRHLLLAGGCAAAAIGAGVVTAMVTRRAPAPVDIPGFLWPQPRGLPEFSVRGSGGIDVDRAWFNGHWTFLFFGYTHCPDVCPTTLAALREVMVRLRADGSAEGVRALFVSVDPERDTDERLAEYVGFFDDSFVGARAPHTQLAPLTEGLGIVYARGEADADGRYEVDHVAAVLLVDPAGRVVGIFGLPHVADDIADRFVRMRDVVEAYG